MFDIKALMDRFDINSDQFREVAGLEPDRMEELLRGSDLSLAELRRISFAFKVSLSSLVEKNEKQVLANMLFRRGVPAGKEVDQLSIDEMTFRISHSFDLVDSTREPFWAKHFLIEEENYQTAERCAEQFRRVFFDGDFVSPLLRLPRIVVENMNVLLFVLDIKNIEGAAAYINGQPFIFLAHRFPPRMLFTLAHEVGHVLAHSTDGDGFAVMDFENDTAPLPPDQRMMEAFANAFSSTLLLPAAGVGVALKKVREIANITSDQIGDIEILFLSRIFGTSFQVAAKRCEDLKLIPIGGAASLYEFLVKEAGSPEKRAMELNLPERPDLDFPAIPPRLLSSAIEKIKSGDISVGRAATILGVSISQIMAAHAPASH